MTRRKPSMARPNNFFSVASPPLACTVGMVESASLATAEQWAMASFCCRPYWPTCLDARRTSTTSRGISSKATHAIRQSVLKVKYRPRIVLRKPARTFSGPSLKIFCISSGSFTSRELSVPTECVLKKPCSCLIKFPNSSSLSRALMRHLAKANRTPTATFELYSNRRSPASFRNKVRRGAKGPRARLIWPDDVVIAAAATSMIRP
mmetsp:Transcript_39168/g.98015  ORF Transcript_39168/g.98015 Transcript_39168/m.98015 type:complete len:206 (+) Transcript_39168:56-673(+)